MSIAVSVVVGPSRIHRLLSLGCGLAQSGAALAVGIAAPARFPSAPWLALALAATAAVLIHSGLRRPKAHRIDISGTGELRVTVQQDMGVGGAPPGGLPAAGVPVHLLPGSVAWPVLAVLRYRVPGAPAKAAAGALPVWRDSMDAAAWRALAVALAVIGRRGRGERFDKIR
jgi:hypothetical protein